METDKTRLLEEIIDAFFAADGLKHLSKTDLAVALYFWRCGYVGAHGLPEGERYRVGDAVGIGRSATYDAVRTLIQVGLLHQLPVAGNVCLALRPGWKPAWQPGEAP